MVRPLTESEWSRISRYRVLEAEALKAAAACKEDHSRNAYQTIAAGWSKLISDIEEMARHEEERDLEFFPPPARARIGKILGK